ncbi:unnamed protein product [Nippostrongylus brasiliensis]|uniref:CCHC-type domain-containing protein n=1 Tax=Nippostrongylus brasiliensis TaxID=27835 RepID=A0A0N4XW72_NIPBR|nr:unnamed protein product [Nippostrongylus brasiliensis]
MTEEVDSARNELVASISSQVADGIGPIISQLVEKKIREERKGSSHRATPQVPTLSHPGLQAQASLLAKWIGQVDDIEGEPDAEEKSQKISELRKSLKRRLTTVVGADTDASIFSLADNFEKVESVIDQTDDFGKAVAEHLKKFPNTKNQQARKKIRMDQPFRRSGYLGEAGVPARIAVQPSPMPQPLLVSQPPTNAPGSSGMVYPPFAMPPLLDNAFYSPYQRRNRYVQQKPCFNCGLLGHIAASCPTPRKPQQQ